MLSSPLYLRQLPLIRQLAEPQKITKVLLLVYPKPVIWTSFDTLTLINY